MRRPPSGLTGILTAAMSNPLAAGFLERVCLAVDARPGVVQLDQSPSAQLKLLSEGISRGYGQGKEPSKEEKAMKEIAIKKGFDTTIYWFVKAALLNGKDLTRDAKQLLELVASSLSTEGMPPYDIQFHKVENGQTLNKVAGTYDVSPDDLLRATNLAARYSRCSARILHPDKLGGGETLVIPHPNTTGGWGNENKTFFGPEHQNPQYLALYLLTKSALLDIDEESKAWKFLDHLCDSLYWYGIVGEGLYSAEGLTEFAIAANIFTVRPHFVRDGETLSTLSDSATPGQIQFATNVVSPSQEVSYIFGADHIEKTDVVGAGKWVFIPTTFPERHDTRTAFYKDTSSAIALSHLLNAGVRSKDGDYGAEVSLMVKEMTFLALTEGNLFHPSEIRICQQISLPVVRDYYFIRADPFRAGLRHTSWYQQLQSLSPDFLDGVIDFLRTDASHYSLPGMHTVIGGSQFTSYGQLKAQPIWVGYRQFGSTNCEVSITGYEPKPEDRVTLRSQ